MNAMRTTRSVAVAGACVLQVLCAASLMAHHSFASEFDANKPIRFTGTVTKMEWINPHAWIHISVKKPDGTVEEWMIEAGTPNTLFRRGLTKQSLLPGTEVVVDGYQAKDGALRANGRDLTLPNGQTLLLGGSSETGAPSEDKSKK
jgi:hypothetical protein